MDFCGRALSGVKPDLVGSCLLKEEKGLVFSLRVQMPVVLFQFRGCSNLCMFRGSENRQIKGPGTGSWGDLQW